MLSIVTTSPGAGLSSRAAGAMSLPIPETESVRDETFDPERALYGLFWRSPVPIALVDENSRRIVEVNQAFCGLLGYDRNELVRLSMDELDTAPPSDVEEHLLAAVRSERQPVRRHAFRAKGGAEITVETRVTPLEGTRGTLLALHVRDVRDEHRAEQDRSTLQARLWMAQKHEAVGRLAAGIAHDFNNLLSAVMLTTESLRKQLADKEDACEDLDIIAEAGLRARELTGQLLAFSGRQMMEPRPLRLNDVVAGMEGIIRRTLPEDIDLTIELANGMTAVSADPAQMQQVLLNLVVNARDSMRGGGRLVVAVQEAVLDEAFARSHTSVNPGPHVMLSVTDTGCGMDEETQARIFEPFFSTQEYGGAVGLGLATVYGIVKQSGGTIWVTSQPGVGTTFRVYLPRIEASSLPTPIPEGHRTGSVTGGTEHVLLVENEPRVRELAGRILRDLGYAVTEASSGDEALELHDELWPHSGPHPIDFVVTDVVMPGISGLELIRRLRIKREDLKALFISGYLDPSSVENSKVPIEPLLSKPFTKVELAGAVRALRDG